MEFLANLGHYAWSFVVILSVIVFIHEFGHYIVAKWCGVKVEAFSIGFGKELFGWNDKSGTRWKVSLLPFGGYVKMFGDAGAASTEDKDKIEAMSEEDKSVSFHFKPLWQKALVVAAGPVANFLLTIAVFTYFIYSSGLTSSEPIVGEIISDTPAQSAGLQPGDRILTVDGENVEKFGDISRKISLNLGEPVELTLLRQEAPMTLTITPMAYDDVDALGNPIKRPLIGFKSTELTNETLTFPQALGEAANRTYEICVLTLTSIGQIISGDRSAEELKGPLGIAKLSGQVTQSGDTTDETVRMILWFIAMLSANLGLINLLPIPLLDGGHLLFYAIHGMRGRPMAEKVQEYGFRLGFAMIMTLMAFTLYNDVRQIVF